MTYSTIIQNFHPWLGWINNYHVLYNHVKKQDITLTIQALQWCNMNIHITRKLLLIFPLKSFCKMEQKTILKSKMYLTKTTLFSQGPHSWGPD